jgi:hypothetical protein
MHVISVPSFRIRKNLPILTIIILLLLTTAGPVFAKPATRQQAEKSVKGWLKVNPTPLDTPLPDRIEDVITFQDEQNEPLYYVVYLQPDGFVIVPADDEVEPIIAFAPTGTFDPSLDNPLGALVSYDLPNRIKTVRKFHATPDKIQKNLKTELQENTQKAQKYWKNLQTHSNSTDSLDNNSADSLDNDSGETAGSSTISDVRVAPLTQTTWNQGNVSGSPCYNYYTPNNYICGCVATAMAQLMRYHQHPASGIGSHSYFIYIGDSIVPTLRSLRGGDGSGGSYNWSAMVLTPNSTITTTQRQAIGNLCYDAGVSVGMRYKSDGSSADTYDAADRYKDPFQYSNAIAIRYPSLGTELNRMLNPNLDAQNPCQLAIKGGDNNHSIICDGYGYEGATLYHHLNMGWGGSSNAWYNLPTINDYDTVKTCVYNVFTSGTGEIISGRVLDPGGSAIAGATVTANNTYQAITNEKGIYALVHVPSNTSFTVNASKSGWIFSPKSIGTGKSQNGSNCGNRWNQDFTGTASSGILQFNQLQYAAPDTITVTLLDSGILGYGSQNITLETCSDYETMTLTENPANSGYFTGSISLTHAAIVAGDGTIQATGSQDLFAIYEDGDNGAGSPETIEATAEIKTWFAILETDFTASLPAGWSVIDGYSDGKTWQIAQASSYPDNQAYVNGSFMVCNSDAAGAIDMDEQLITPSLNCTAFETVNLEFSHFFVNYEAEIADVDIRVNGGAWQNLAQYTGQKYSGPVQLDLTSLAAGSSNVQVRWHYYNANWEWYWGIDDVKITGQTPVRQIPSDLNSDCRVDIEDLVIFAENWLVHY